MLSDSQGNLGEVVQGRLSSVVALPAGPPAVPWKTKGFTDGWLLSFELC